MSLEQRSKHGLEVHGLERLLGSTAWRAVGTSSTSQFTQFSQASPAAPSSLSCKLDSAQTTGQPVSPHMHAAERLCSTLSWLELAVAGSVPLRA